MEKDVVNVDNNIIFIVVFVVVTGFYCHHQYSGTRILQRSSSSSRWEKNRKGSITGVNIARERVKVIMRESKSESERLWWISQFYKSYDYYD